METSNAKTMFTATHEQDLLGFWDWNISAKQKYMSPAFKNMLGYEDQEIPNDPDSWISLILKEDRPVVINAYQKHVVSKGTYPYEVKVRYRHKNGGTVYILSKGKVTEWDNMGNPVRMIGYFTDVTSIIKEFAGLEEKHEQFKAVIDYLNVGIWTIDVKTGRNYWSDNIYNLTGYTSDELAPSYFNLLHVLSHSEDTSKLVAAIDAQVRNKQPYNLHLRLLNKEQNYDWFEAAGTVSSNESKSSKVSGFFIKQRQPWGEPVEQKPEVTEEQTKESSDAEAKIAAANPSKDALQNNKWEYNLNDAKFSFSREVYDMLELNETASMRFQSINSMFTKESQGIFQKAFNTAVYNKEEYEITLVCRTPKGSLKMIREKGKPVIDETGKVTGLKGTMELVNQQESTSPEIMASYLEMLTEQNQRLWNFAHIASHNLRSHASNLQMTLEVINTCEREEEKKIFMKSIHKISTALSQTIGNLNKLLSNETDLNKAKIPIAFKDVLLSVTSALESQINETQTVIESDFEECPTIEYIPSYLESIILNLVSNAIKYRHPERAPQIVLRSSIKDGSKVLLVRDNGIGLDPVKQQTLFSPNQTITRHPDSTGLGLIITKNQVESSGGSIEVESELGTGTTFTIRF